MHGGSLLIYWLIKRRPFAEQTILYVITLLIDIILIFRSEVKIFLCTHIGCVKCVKTINILQNQSLPITLSISILLISLIKCNEKDSQSGFII